MNHRLRSEPRPLPQGHRLLVGQYHAKKARATHDSFSRSVARVITADAVRMHYAEVRDYARKYPLAALAAHAGIGLSLALWLSVGRMVPMLGKRRWWSDVPVNDGAGIQCSDSKLLVDSALLLSLISAVRPCTETCGVPNRLCQHFPLRTGKSSRWTSMSGAGR
jgi:hypothetical protein